MNESAYFDFLYSVNIKQTSSTIDSIREIQDKNEIRNGTTIR